ncbi:DHA2 family efflux MFS transporter permease subunit [Insolitispirillum peregrinum]|uniref:DHA2 family efflux MFS transporter permease subunit n=1 Tax=Insolitispirillum peregrinum TaxID=80876 RepID=UPI0036187485
MTSRREDGESSPAEPLPAMAEYAPDEIVVPAHESAVEDELPDDGEQPVSFFNPGRPALSEGRSYDMLDKIGFLAMIIGMFMAILDIQIVSSSLGELQAGLSASHDEISWVQTSYLIAEVIMIPISGWLSHLLSTRILFFISATTFTIASAACAFAWNLESMILFRALQGFLGGAMIPTVFATSYSMFPRSKQAGVTVVIGLVATMAPTLGPTLGGYLTASLSWHWLFLINVLPGALVAATVFLAVNVDRPNFALLKGFDLKGVILVALFLGSMEYVLEEGPRDDWFDDSTITALIALCSLSGLAFLWHELTTAAPIINLRAFGNRNFALGCVYSFIIGIGLYGSVYVIPQFLGQVKGYNSLQIGELIMVTGVFQFCSAPLAGALSKKMDLRLMLAIGLVCFALGLYLNSSLTADWGWWDFFLPQAIRGISLMFLFIPVNALALGTLPPEMLKGGSGLYNLMRNLGGAIGLAVINTQLSDELNRHLLYLKESVTLARLGVLNEIQGLTAALTPAMGPLAEKAALSKLGAMVYQQATVLAFSDVLVMMASVFLFGFLFMPLMRKVNPGGGGGDAH